ncbi:MAG: hypothetical protein K0S16_727, partial [Moraxellaceae bacterium]|nr:hypothetical protein [Moraxellaceae bacterium]
KGEYTAPLWPDGRLAPGSASWAQDASYRWLVVPSQRVRIGGGAAPAAPEKAAP